MLELNLEKGWMVFQDIHHLGEKAGVPGAEFDNTGLSHCVSEYEPLPFLKHLQTLLWETPYYGRGLRQFNMAPWWYRNKFKTPQGAGSKAVLVFDGADYFARVWINGNLLGGHEGYFGRFEFDVTGYICREPDKDNTIHVLVSSPWDKEPAFEEGRARFWSVERHLIKGTYEHDDTFVNRDVNPVGICAPVRIIFFEEARISHVKAAAKIENGKGLVEVDTVLNGAANIHWSLIDAQTGAGLISRQGKTGKDVLCLDNPVLWKPWDQGKGGYYILRTVISSGQEILDVNEQHIGFRSAEFRRTPEETSYILNGKKIFLRGCTYFPDNYISLMSEGRYRRDLRNIKAAGFNAVRIHVHVEQDIFYDLCDEMGILVFQDTDLNWVQERGEALIRRAENLFSEMAGKLASHPSLGAWICYNEPDGKEDGYFMRTGPAPQLAALARKLSPGIPYIMGSWCDKDPESGDTHNYLGSLNGEETHYLDAGKSAEKFNTEFGFDAPPCVETMLKNKAILNRLSPGAAEIEAIQYYQYRLLKFYIENYRGNKYDPCAGYFQFMFIDLCPQSFYGVYDYYGVEKEGLKALYESNQPLAVMLREKEGKQVLSVVNDTPFSYPSCRAEIRALDAGRRLLFESLFSFDLPPDAVTDAGECEGIRQIRDRVMEIRLILKDGEGHELALNRYEKPFEHPPHPAGHPRRMSHELGMRLYHF
jgi:beta-mannosidase